MATGEARSLLHWSTAKALALDLWAFAKDPTPAPVRLSYGPTMAFALAVLLAIEFGLAVAAAILELGLEGFGHTLPVYEPADLSPFWWFASMLLIVPVVEEGLFRGFLSGTKAALRFAGVAWGVIATIVVAALFVDATVLGGVSIIFFGILFAALLYWLAYRDRHATRPAWFLENYKWLVWGSSLAFGLGHLTVYVGIDDPLDLVVIGSTVLSGLVLAYTRTRLGLVAAMIQHALFNAMLLYLF